MLPTSDGIQLVKVKDIIRCQSDGNYTIIHLTDKKSILVSRTLKEYGQMLWENGFHRVHQSHLVNIEYVTRFVNRDGGYIVMEDGSNVTISRRKKEDFLARLFKE